MRLTIESVMAGTGCTEDLAALWIGPLQAAVDKHLDGERKTVATFLIAVGCGSDGLTKLSDKNPATPQALADKWPGVFALDPHMDPKIPNALANKAAGNDDAVSQAIPGHFRPRGPIRVTSRKSFNAFLEESGQDESTSPDTLEHPENGSLAAAWAFSKNAATLANSTSDVLRERYNKTLALMVTEPPPAAEKATTTRPKSRKSKSS